MKRRIKTPSVKRAMLAERQSIASQKRNAEDQLEKRNAYQFKLTKTLSRDDLINKYNAIVPEDRRKNLTGPKNPISMAMIAGDIALEIYPVLPYEDEAIAKMNIDLEPVDIIVRTATGDILIETTVQSSWVKPHSLVEAAQRGTAITMDVNNLTYTQCTVELVTHQNESWDEAVDNAMDEHRPTSTDFL